MIDPDDAVFVTDTSVILNLCWLQHERLLIELYGRIFAPDEVWREFQLKAVTDERFLGLTFPSAITVRKTRAIPMEVSLNKELHGGEAAALALALELGARNILVDEQAGRAAARSMGLRVTGLLGILIEGKRAGLVPAVQPLLKRLVQEARFWIAPALQQQALRAVGEA